MAGVFGSIGLAAGEALRSGGAGHTAAPVPGSEPLPAVPAGTTIDKLLTPNANDKDPQFAHFGTLAVERSHLAEFQQAQKYLAKEPEALSALYQLEHAKDAHTIQFITNGDDRYDPSNKTLYWDPKSALMNTNGTTQTPALGLLHEESHLIEDQRDPAQFLAGVRDTTPTAYYNREEKRVIEGIEARVGKALGEGIRHDHGGTAYNAIDPISRTPAPTRRAEIDAPSAIQDKLIAARSLGADVPPNVAGAEAVRPWDGKPHVGSFVHLDDNTAAQHIGRGQYMVYDVEKNLGGITPPQGVRDVAINARGHVDVAQLPDRANER